MVIFIIVSFLLSATALLLVPLASFDEETWRRVLAYAAGGLFWVGFAAGVAGMLLWRKQMKEAMEKDSLSFWAFFSSREAMVFDILFVACVVAFGVILFVPGIPRWVVVGQIFLMLFSLEMRFVLNSRSYRCFVKCQKLGEGVGEGT